MGNVVGQLRARIRTLQYVLAREHLGWERARLGSQIHALEAQLEKSNDIEHLFVQPSLFDKLLNLLVNGGRK